MKAFASILLVVALICGSSSEDTGPLGDAFEYLTESIKSVSNSKSYGKYINKIDFNCAKESLNLTKNSHKMVNEVQAIIISVAAYVKCLKTNEEETLDFATKLVIEEYGVKVEPTETDEKAAQNVFRVCYKQGLLNIEPTSKLLDGFDGPSADPMDFCKHVPIDELADHTIQPIAEQIGPIETATCGAADRKLVANFLIKFNLIPAEKREDVRKEETQKMVDLFRTRIIATSDCIIKSI